MKTEEQLREEIWNKLRKIYYKYTNNSEILSLAQLELLLKQIFHQYSPIQRDYVTKNLFRIDLDNNGTIQFSQFGKFILQRHCAQITLQRMHANNEIKLSKERKILLPQFKILINRAFKFLDAEFPDQIINKIFYSKDVQFQKKKSNNYEPESNEFPFLTYAQTLRYVEKFALSPNDKRITSSIPTSSIQTSVKALNMNSDNYVYTKEKTNSAPLVEVGSRFRKFLWGELRNLYQYYDKDKNHILDELEVQNLVYQILKNISKQQTAQIIFNSYKINPNTQYKITFNEFAPFFILETALLGLSKLNRDLIENKKKIITKQKFISLIRNTFNYIPISRVTDQLILKFFQKLTSKDSPNFITYQAYLKWIIQFLCANHYFGNQYYIQEDDQKLSVGNQLILSNQTNTQKASNSKNSLSNLKQQSQQILSMLSISIQQKLIKLCLLNIQYLIVNKYDVNKNNVLEKSEVQALLADQLKYSEDNVKNFIKRILDYFKVNTMSHIQFIRFLLFIHLKEYSLLEFVKANKLKLKRPNEQMLNINEFTRFIDFATCFIIYKQPNQQIEQIFKNIDRNNDGWISFKEYEDYINLIFTRLNLNQKNDQDSYYRRIWINLRHAFSLYDTSRAGSLSEKELQKLLRERFLISSNSDISTILTTLIKDLKQRRVSFSQFAPFMINYVAQSILKRYHLLQQNTNDKINESYFYVIVSATFEYAKNGTKKDQIDQIFKRLDTDKDGYLKYSQFLRWVDKDISKVPR